MAVGNGLNLGVGIDLSQFDKDLSYVNRKLKTVDGQVELATIKFKDSDNPLIKQIQQAQKMYNDAFSGMSRVLYEKIGKNGKMQIFDINNIIQINNSLIQRIQQCHLHTRSYNFHRNSRKTST